MLYYSYKLLAYCKGSSPGSLQQQSISWCGSMQACKRCIIAHCMNAPNVECGFSAVAGNRVWCQKEGMYHEDRVLLWYASCVAGDLIPSETWIIFNRPDLNDPCDLIWFQRWYRGIPRGVSKSFKKPFLKSPVYTPAGMILLHTIIIIAQYFNNNNSAL